MPRLLLWPLLALLIGYVPGPAVGRPRQAMRLELVHRETLAAAETGVERMRELVRHDVARYRVISGRREKGRRRLEEEKGGAVEMRLESGRDYGTGQYFTEIRVGTPAQRFRVVVDTGSDLTWISCRYRCGSKCARQRRFNRRRVFNADRSASFRTVPCSSQTCKVDLMNLFSLTRCPTSNSPCAYDFRYLDGSSARGIFAKETLTVGLTDGRKARLRDVLIGCSGSFQGQSLRRADGVLGLAHSPYSLTAKATEAYGGKFSYCLVDHLSHRNVSNYLLIGSGHEKNRSPCLLARKRRTRLELDLIPPFYALSLVRISVAGKKLEIPPEVWEANRGGGTILDSGSSLTLLAEPAYRAVVSALLGYLSRYERVKLDDVPLEHCFNAAAFDESSVPTMVFHFADGARLNPHRKSYVIDAAEGVRCLGFLSAGSPGTNVIGNIMQQNYLWEFDLAKGAVSFAPSTCT